MTNEKVVLQLEKREENGRKAASLRQSGKTPGVIYGKGMKPVMVQAATTDALKVVKKVGRRQSLQLDLDGKQRTAIIKNISRHPARDTIENIEFHAIKQNEKIVTKVPIELVGTGESPAERAGLMVLQAVEALEIKALPKNLPEKVTISTENLAAAGQHVTVADITLPEGVEVEGDLDVVVASVYEPAALQAANEAAGGDAEADVDIEEAVEADNGGTSEAGADENKKEGNASN